MGIGVWRPTGERSLDLTIVFQDIDPSDVVAQVPNTGFGTRLTVDTKTPLNLTMVGTPMIGTPVP